jgi:DNA-binding transcriptional regulator GbsR (MarR family)
MVHNLEFKANTGREFWEYRYTMIKTVEDQLLKINSEIEDLKKEYEKDVEEMYEKLLDLEENSEEYSELLYRIQRFESEIAIMK